MRFFAPALSLFAAVAIAQTSTTQQNAPNNPNGGFNPVPGEDLTVTWANPSDGTVTIKLQMGSDITPSSGIVLARGIQASSESATVTIPSDVANGQSYTFEIIDESNPSNINFSAPFAITGGADASSSSMITSTASSASSSSTGSASDSSSTTSDSSSSRTGSSSTASSSSSSETDSSSSSSTVSRTSSSSSTRTSSSATMSATTAAPNSNTNGASGLKIEGSLVALVAGLVALF